MTDVRERVARAIAKVLYLDGEPGDDTETGTPYLLADAALSALGWREMVEALERYQKATKRVADNVAEFGTVTDIDFLNDLWSAEDAASATLSRARGEKT